MMSGKKSPVRYIRLGEEGVTASELGPSENQAMLNSDLQVSLFSAYLTRNAPIDVSGTSCEKSDFC